ncbi:MAG: outer membrane protein assembly factor BamC [Candidatus Nitrotoga sp.]|jgi:uncharacterized lipoprotein|nr:outer membrane protein assembly factor BamC [Candidatus Nitrotoga sp.]MDW7604071.1 outer membrane protein assembly factor BamC [Candidatus Nitrotoga sp.]MDW7612222.1 outer membrane protein assembly factor BamC [Candidatus Nitrotoga sp.]
MKTSHLFALLLSLLTSVGCSYIGLENKKVDYKSTATKVPALEIPPDLTTPAIKDQYAVPGNEVAGGTSDSPKGDSMAKVTNQTTASPSSDATTAARLKEIGGGNKVIVLDESFDKSWRKVGLSLEQAGLEIKDKDRVGGVYFVNLIKDATNKTGWVNTLMFWRKNEDQKSTNNSGRYQVIVRQNNAGCEVSALNQSAGKDAETQRIIELVYKNLNT